MIRIAGIRFSLIPANPLSPASLADAYQPFQISDSTDLAPDGCYRILAPDRPCLPPIDGESFWSNEIWRMGPCGAGFGIEIYDVIRSRWVPVARIDQDFAAGEIQPFHGRRAAPSVHALNYPYDQAILINRLLRRDVIVVHGAGIVVDGRGYVFFGPSGIGKTTISRLWRNEGAALLNDDRVAIFKAKDGSWHLGGTPWHGEEPKVSPECAPLGGLVRLRQSPSTSLREMDAGEGISELLACALIPFFSRDAIERAVDLFSELPDTVPLLEFSFKPEPAALRLFRDRTISFR